MNKTVMYNMTDERGVDTMLRENIEDVASMTHLLIVFGVPIVLCWWAGVPWHVIIVAAA